MTNRSSIVGDNRFKPGWFFILPLDLLSRLAGVGVTLIAVMVLLGWYLGLPVLHTIVPSLPPMVPITAVGFMLSGLALYLLQPEEIVLLRRRTGQALAILCFFLGLLTVFEYLRLIPEIGHERLLLPVLGQEAVVLKQSLPSALAFMMAGTALFLLGFSEHRLTLPIQWLAIVSLALAVVVLFGYIYGLTVYSRYATTLIGMALPTSAGFIILANGILLARPREGVMRFITSDTAGGVIIRRLLPSVVLAPMVIGWLMLAGQKIGLLSEEFGVAMYGVLTMLLITLIIVRIAVSLNREQKLRRSAEEGARRYQADLAHLVRLVTMGEMVASITHELKQPLTAITLYADYSKSILSAEPLQREELKKYLEEIQGQSIRAVEIIRRTRDFVRNQKPQTCRVQINSVITEVRDFLSEEARQHRIQLSLELDPLLPPADADPVQIKQVLLNIVHNAIESLQLSESKIKLVTVRTQLTAAGEIKVEIIDTGPGMDAEILARIFESFFTTKNDAGMGMGLSISRSIIEAHGGQLCATSAPGQGATFSLTLPQHH